MFLQKSHNGILPMTTKSLRLLLKKIALNFHALPVLIARVYYTPQSAEWAGRNNDINPFANISLTTNLRNPANLQLVVDQNKRTCLTLAPNTSTYP